MDHNDDNGVETEMQSKIITAVSACVAVLVAGCAPTGAYYPQGNMYGQVGAYGDAPSAYPASAAPQQHMGAALNGQANTGNLNQLTSEMTILRERVIRMERAIVRLDRRMQLIERNELSRMSGQTMQGAMTPATQGAFQPMSYQKKNAEPQTLSAVPTPKARQYANYQPVSYPAQAEKITSSLGVAPKQPQSYTPNATPKSAFSGLPSLADTQQDADDHKVSIWTINYQQGKVWPHRNQLPASRDVVESINSGKAVALFARGVNPSSKEFRDRVRAISKYLSKVTDTDQISIASMSAKHLDGDTIELLASY